MDRDALYQQFARIGQAAASPQRLRLLNQLAQGEKSVEALAEHLGQSLAATSAHLKVLRSACLVESRKAGRHVYYRVAHPQVEAFWMALQTLGEAALPEVRELVRMYFSDREALVEMSGDELMRQVEAGKVTLIDLRPVEEFAAGHLPGAKSCPLGAFDRWSGRLPRRKPVVAYCRGPYCLAALEGVKRMREAGLNARRLPIGIVGWRYEGYAVETGHGGNESIN